MANWNVYGSAVLIVAGLFLSGCSSASYDEPTIGNPELRQFLEDYWKKPNAKVTDIPEFLRDKYVTSGATPPSDRYAISFVSFFAKKLNGNLTRRNVIASIRSLNGGCHVSVDINSSLDSCKVNVQYYQFVPTGPSIHKERRVYASLNIRTELLIEYSGSADTDTIKKLTVLHNDSTMFEGLEKYEPSCQVQSSQHGER